MNFMLLRQVKESDGVFGTLTSDDNSFSCVTLEHSFDSGLGNGSYEPKLPVGTYTCKRSQHQLEGMTQPFTTFQIITTTSNFNQPLTNVLFHVGNYNADSDGCVLLGRRIVPNPNNPSNNMITSSKNTFNAFMDFLRNLNEFTLTVKDN